MGILLEPGRIFDARVHLRGSVSGSHILPGGWANGAVLWLASPLVTRDIVGNLCLTTATTAYIRTLSFTQAQAAMSPQAEFPGRFLPIRYPR